MKKEIKKYMAKKTKNKIRLKIRKNSLLGKIILVAFLLIVVLLVFRYAGYFKREDNSKLQIMIQNEIDVELAHDVYIDDNGIIYFSEEDMKTYFDEELYYEKDESNMRRYFSMSQNKILEITENANHMYVNGNFIKIKGKVIEKEGVFYFPLSELTDVYNLEVDYLADTNKLNIEKLSEEKIVAVVNRDTELKYKMTDISRTEKKLSQGETVTVIEEMSKKWVKVKTSDYMIGYIKKSKLTDFEKERENLDIDLQYFKDFDMDKDIVISLESSVYENFNEKIETYEGRTDLCLQISAEILKTISENDLSEKNVGVKVESSQVTDKNNFYRFLEELKVYSNSNGCYLIVTQNNELDVEILNKIANLVI